MNPADGNVKVVVLTGGVGGVKLVDGLAAILPPQELQIVVNTGDDFEHWGLHISPDVDTVMYTLAGLSHPDQGWGLNDESFRVLESMRRFGADDWFQLGDKDLATHITRSEKLRSGVGLTEVTRLLSCDLGVEHSILPMSDGPRATFLDTASDGRLPFQEWLVQMRGAPLVESVIRVGNGQATASVLASLTAADLVVFGPSNPYVSIDPILELPGVLDAMADKPVVAVSPIVAGSAVKGPLAAMIPSLAGVPPSAEAIVRHYGDLLTGIVIEHGDRVDLGLKVLETNTIMTCKEERVRLAEEVLAFARGLLR